MTILLYHRASASFAAARHLAALPADHRAHRRHGHQFRAIVCAQQWHQSAIGAETLSQQLVDTLAALDYQDLNQHFTNPSDDTLGHWLGQRLALPGEVNIGLHSTATQGVELNSTQRLLWRHFHFEAAHRLPNVAADHPCGRMHGHGFAVTLTVPLAAAAPGAGYDALDQVWAPLHQRLHLHCLNDLPGLDNPTSEHLAHWLWQQLRPQLPELVHVRVHETASAGCQYDGIDYRIWKEQRFESALCLAHAPAGDPRRRLHGHSYRLRLHLCAPLDAVLGWTLDYGDVKTLFHPIYQQLDHQRLDQRLESPDLGRLATWIYTQTIDSLPQLERLDLHQTADCGVSLCAGRRLTDTA